MYVFLEISSLIASSRQTMENHQNTLIIKGSEGSADNNDAVGASPWVVEEPLIASPWTKNIVVFS